MQRRYDIRCDLRQKPELHRIELFVGHQSRMDFLRLSDVDFRRPILGIFRQDSEKRIINNEAIVMLFNNTTSGQGQKSGGYNG